MQLPFLYYIRRLPALRIDFKEPGVRRVLRTLLGALLGLSINQVSLFLDTLFASFLVAGSISWIYYAGRLMNFPLGMIGVAIATVVMPKLSRSYAAHSNDQFLITLRWGIQVTLLLGVPAAIGLFTLAKPLLWTLFGYGQFSAWDVTMTAHALQAFACGVPAFMLIKVLNTALCARQQIQLVVKISACTLFTNLILNGILIRPFAHVGLIVATTLSSWLSVIGLIVYLQYPTTTHPALPLFNRESRRFIGKVLLAGTGMWVWLWCAQLLLGEHWVNGVWHQRVIYLLSMVIVAKLVYFGGVRLLGIQYRHFTTVD